VNKKEGYEIKVPKEWGGVKETEFGYGGYFLIKGESKGQISVIMYKLEKNETVENFIQKGFDESKKFVMYSPGYPKIIGPKTINGDEVIEVKESKDDFVYYLKKDLKIYSFSSNSEKDIEEIISNNFFK